MKDGETITGAADRQRATIKTVLRWFFHVSGMVAFVYTLFVGARSAVELWSNGKESAAIWMALLMSAGASAVMMEVSQWFVPLRPEQRIILLAVLIGVVVVVQRLLGG